MRSERSKVGDEKENAAAKVIYNGDECAAFRDWRRRDAHNREIHTRAWIKETNEV